MFFNFFLSHTPPKEVLNGKKYFCRIDKYMFNYVKYDVYNNQCLSFKRLLSKCLCFNNNYNNNNDFINIKTRTAATDSYLNRVSINDFNLFIYSFN